MWKLRSCTKCGGDLYVDRDLDGWFEQCLQCGHVHDLVEVVGRKTAQPSGEGDMRPLAEHKGRDR